MEEFSQIVSNAISIFTRITILGIPMLFWEFFIDFVAIVVRLLFGRKSKPDVDGKGK